MDVSFRGGVFRGRSHILSFLKETKRKQRGCDKCTLAFFLKVKKKGGEKCILLYCDVYQVFSRAIITIQPPLRVSVVFLATRSSQMELLVASQVKGGGGGGGGGGKYQKMNVPRCVHTPNSSQRYPKARNYSQSNSSRLFEKSLFVVMFGF